MERDQNHAAPDRPAQDSGEVLLSRAMKRALAIALLALAAPLLAQKTAQKKTLTYESIYDPVGKVYFNGAIQSDFEWVDDTTLLWPRKDVKGDFAEWRLYDIATGKERALFDRAKLQRALVGTGLPKDIAKDAAASDAMKFDAKKSTAVVSANEDLYLYSIDKGTVVRLTSAPGEEEEAAFSPDGQRVAFVRANDLYVVDLAGRERRLTTDGSAEILNGKLDYVYQEEVYGRGIWKSFWWSPDSLRIAFLQLDERPVPEFTVVDHIPPASTTEPWRSRSASARSTRRSPAVSRSRGCKRVSRRWRSRRNTGIHGDRQHARRLVRERQHAYG